MFQLIIFFLHPFFFLYDLFHLGLELSNLVLRLSDFFKKQLSLAIEHLYLTFDVFAIAINRVTFAADCPVEFVDLIKVQLVFLLLLFTLTLLFELLVFILELLMIFGDGFVVVGEGDYLYLKLVVLQLVAFVEVEYFFVFLPPLLTLLFCVLQILSQTLLQF